jgi:hypothetical protein
VKAIRPSPVCGGPATIPGAAGPYTMQVVEPLPGIEPCPSRVESDV